MHPPAHATEVADVMRVQGELDSATTLHQEAIQAFQQLGDRSTVAIVQLSLAKVLIAKQDFSTARRTLQEALQTNLEIGAKGDAALAKIMLAEVAFYEGHPEQFDNSVQESIKELASEGRAADEMEAHAILAQAYLRLGKIDEARQSVSRAQSIHGTDWLAKFHLSVSAAQVHAAAGSPDLARTELRAAQAEAIKVGCKLCAAEIRSNTAKLTIKNTARNLSPEDARSHKQMQPIG